MARLLPLVTLRPNITMPEKVIAPPREALDAEEAARLAEGRPYSFLHILRSEMDLPPEEAGEETAGYAKAGDCLERFLRYGAMVDDFEPGLYLYRRSGEEGVRLGLVAGVPVEDYAQGKLQQGRPAERAREEERSRCFLHLRAQLEPVMMGFPAEEAVDAALKAAEKEGERLYDLEDDRGIRHEIIKVDNNEHIVAIQAAFQKIQALYLAEAEDNLAAASALSAKLREEDPRPGAEEEYELFAGVLLPLAEEERGDAAHALLREARIPSGFFVHRL